MADPVNHHVKNLAVAGVGHRFTSAWFRPNGANSPTAFGGAYVSSVTRQGVGRYLITLRNFRPVSFVAGCGQVTVVGANNASLRIGEVVITPETATVTLMTYLSNGVPRALIDFAVQPNPVRYELHWKMFSGKDWSGL